MASLAVSLTSWFKLAGQGMQRYEFLSRGSAFLVQEAGGLRGFLCAAHTASPWLRPPPRDAPAWLHLLSTANVRHMLEIRSETGQLLLCWPFATPSLHVAAGADVAVLQLQDAARFDVACSERQLQLPPLALADRQPYADERLLFCGHDIAHTAASSSSSSSSGSSRDGWPLSLSRDPAAAQQPVMIEGHSTAIGSSSAMTAVADSNFAPGSGDSNGSASGLCWAYTERRLPHGMSGGPVLSATAAAAGSGLVLGMTTAVAVPRNAAAAEGEREGEGDGEGDPYSSLAAFAPAPLLRTVLEDAHYAQLAATAQAATGSKRMR